MRFTYHLARRSSLIAVLSYMPLKKSGKDYYNYFFISILQLNNCALPRNEVSTYFTVSVLFIIPLYSYITRRNESLSRTARPLGRLYAMLHNSLKSLSTVERSQM